MPSCRTGAARGWEKHLPVRTFPTESPPIETPVRSTESPLVGAIDSFLRSRHDLKEGARKSYRKCLLRIAKSCPTIADLDADNLNEYLSAKMLAGHQTVAHHDGQAAKQLAKWMVEARILKADPLIAVHVPPQPKHPRMPFDDSQIPTIRAASRKGEQPERDEAIIVLALACGLRLGELLALQYPRDIDLAGARLVIRQAKTEAGVRTVPISRAVLPVLDTYINDFRPPKPGALFLNRHGDDFSYDGFSKIFRRIRKRLPASVDFKAHRARNTALTNWRRAGTDIWTIGKIAGHKRIEHTANYMGAITPAEIESVPDAFSRFHGRRSA
jgi:integrase/recombinase XerD